MNHTESALRGAAAKPPCYQYQFTLNDLMINFQTDQTLMRNELRFKKSIFHPIVDEDMQVSVSQSMVQRRAPSKNPESEKILFEDALDPLIEPICVQQQDRILNVFRFSRRVIFFLSISNVYQLEFFLI